MHLNIGQKVAYPNQGICLIEDIERKKIGGNSMDFYSLRVLSDNSTIFVPTENAETIGIRPILGSNQCKNLVDSLAEDFDTVADDWKVRSREYNEKLQSGDVFEAADVLKKLTFLSGEKKLSFREQTLLEKAKFLVVSEITNSGSNEEDPIEAKISRLLKTACKKHCVSQPKVMTATSH